MSRDIKEIYKDLLLNKLLTISLEIEKEEKEKEREKRKHNQSCVDCKFLIIRNNYFYCNNVYEEILNTYLVNNDCLTHEKRED